MPETTWVDTTEYLASRAARHGLSVDDLLDQTPACVLDCPHETMVFWQGRDISHIQSQKNAPHLSDDPSNVMPEAESPNSSRGPDDMTEADIATAHADNQAHAETIDSTYTFDEVSFMPDYFDAVFAI